MATIARRTGPPEIWLPQNATALSLTTGSPGFGAWTNIGSALANDFILTYMRCLWVCNSVSAGVGLVALEAGSGGGATGYAQLRGYGTFQIQGATSVSGWLDFSIAQHPMRIASGTQVQVRGDAPINAQTLEVALLGFDTAFPTFTNLPHDVAIGPDTVQPSDTGAGVAVAGAAFPNFGAWTTLVASAAADMLVYWVGVQENLTDLSAALYPIQLGIGAAGSEVALSTSLVGHVQNNQWLWPPVWVKAGERLAARITGTGATFPVIWKQAPL